MGAAVPKGKIGRVISLDAYRGIVMLLLVSGSYTLFREGFSLAQVASKMVDNETWQLLGRQFSHSPWRGCTFWDLIMPAFIFMTGVSLSYSFARRQRERQDYRLMVFHAAYRTAVLVGFGAVGSIFLGNFVMMKWPKHINVDFSTVLTQIGLAGLFAFFLAGKRLGTQLMVSVVILVGYWLAFALYPAPHLDLAGMITSPQQVGRFDGFYSHWNKDENLAADFDRWLLNSLPRTDPYLNSTTGMQTLNFVPTIATVIFGLAVGDFLRREDIVQRKSAVLAMVGAGALGVGVGLDAWICPLVKSLWTPSWAVYSSGWVLLFLAAFYWLIDERGCRSWAIPFVVVGANSLFAYGIALFGDYWIYKVWEKVLGRAFFAGIYGPLWKSMLLVISVWVACGALYQRGVFVRV